MANLGRQCGQGELFTSRRTSWAAPQVGRGHALAEVYGYRWPFVAELLYPQESVAIGGRQNGGSGIRDLDFRGEESSPSQSRCFKRSPPV